MGASDDVTITIYELVNMTEMPVADGGCYPIGNTGRWGWSTANLPGGTKRGWHFVFRMATSGGAQTFTGEFLLRFPESERGSEKMSAQSPNFREFEYNPDAPQAIVGELTSGASGTVRVWREGVELTLPDNVCTELDGTGRFAWSTVHLPVPVASREQFHWQMDDDQGASDWGDLVRYVPGAENMMPNAGQEASYIHHI